MIKKSIKSSFCFLRKRNKNCPFNNDSDGNVHLEANTNPITEVYKSLFLGVVGGET